MSCNEGGGEENAWIPSAVLRVSVEGGGKRSRAFCKLILLFGTQQRHTTDGWRTAILLPGEKGVVGNTASNAAEGIDRI